ncbi:Uncharacterized conserved protein [Tistlia consotensis]|uniref:Uncharacterized conserved protein n=1 Tax=Tistlia consotensis USBA 355 TaxID=560819 RepID=A0A1Y6CMX4_9PROT|nr:hypothetical protein [Tistlia consotensis]SMF78580.1 Uncharacterized conserved protein [Tistlia consotensis USBA 355]SNS18782.1 Uncharacterized conserved protein [Tistlia consotensis]
MTDLPLELWGGCHCRRLRFRYRTAVPPEDAQPRACLCDFCRRHGSSAVSDPQGRATILVEAPEALQRYRFGLRTADYLLCRVCGVYIGALASSPSGPTSVLMVRAFDERERFVRPAEPVDFSAEGREARLARRFAAWTPTDPIGQAA